MAELYDFTDRDGDGLRVTHDGSNGYVAVSKETGPAAVYAPTGADAVALARAVLAAAGDTGHVVLSRSEIDEFLVTGRKIGARSMRERAATTVELYGEWSRLETPADRIRALPLFPDVPRPAPLTADTDA